MNNLIQKLPHLKKRKLIKISQEKEDGIKIKLQTDNQNWNDWIIQIHWNKLEWENTINCNETNSILCVF